MADNANTIHKFYTGFQNKDFKAMQACYAGNAVFNDPVFTSLNAAQVKAMWEMFCVNGKDLSIEYGNVKSDGDTGSAEWTARYTFSASGNRVVNRIKSNFVFENGLIVKHNDSFDFYTWARQALGITGLLFGWTPFVKRKVQRAAMKSLNRFIETNSRQTVS